MTMGTGIAKNLAGGGIYLIRKIVESYIPDPFTDVEIIDTKHKEDGVVYTVIIDDFVDAEADFRARLETVPAVYHLPETKILSSEVIKNRPLRTTRKMRIKVMKNKVTEQLR